jgi:hypothetical protein
MTREAGQGSRSSERMEGYDCFISLLFYVLQIIYMFHMFISVVSYVTMNLSHMFCRIIICYIYLFSFYSHAIYVAICLFSVVP